MTRTEKRQQRTRRRLIEACRKLTAQKGVEAMTIRDVAEAADIALGSFYTYFPSKQLLLDEAVRETIFDAGEIIDAINADSDDPLDVIATAFTNFDRIVHKDPLLGWFLVNVHSHQPNVTDSLAQRFIRDVSKGMENGFFDIPDIQTTVTMVDASLINFFRRRLLGELADRTVVDMVHLTLRLLGANDTASRRAAEVAARRVGLDVDESSTSDKEA